MNTSDTVILEASFNPKLKSYFVISSLFVLAITIFGICLLPIWIPLAYIVAEKYIKSLHCILTERTLIVKRGMLFKVEKTIPLDKITDLGTLQGPIMRAMGLSSMSIETAGSSAPGALVRLPGIIDQESFQDAVLAQRDKVTEGTSKPLPEAAPASLSTDAPEMLSLLRDIRDSLKAIEGKDG